MSHNLKDPRPSSPVAERTRTTTTKPTPAKSPRRDHRGPSVPTTRPTDLRVKVSVDRKRVRPTRLTVGLVGWGLAMAIGFGGAFGVTSVTGHVRLESARQEAKRAKIRAADAISAANAAENEVGRLARPDAVGRWSVERGLVTTEPTTGELLARR